MADGFDHAVLGQAPPCTFHEQCGAQFGHDRCGQSRREEFVPHCSKSWPRAAMGTMGGGPTYVEGAIECMGCLPAKLERAIDCMRLIAGRTARPSSGISIVYERCLRRSPLSCSVAVLSRRAEVMAWPQSCD